MANKIIIKKSSVAGKVPATGDLEIGELAVNLTDQKLYSKNASGTVIQLGGGSGSGDVIGPSSATDNALARYDGTTGKIIQNGNITEDDNGNLAGVNSVSFDTTPSTPPASTGAMYWDDGNQTPSVNLNADVTLQLGQESVALVYNGTGSTIANGSVVAVAGAQGQRPSVVLADADSEAYSAQTLGIATQAITNESEGFVTTFGFVRGIDTSAFTAGQAIWLSQTAGQFTATRPSAPAHSVFLGWVIKVNASSGEVFVNISNGWELDELHNVLITSPTSGNTLIYDASAGVWKNANLTDGTGITITEGAGIITIANAGVTSLTGTTNEIDVSASTGSVTLSLPATINADTTGNAATATSAGKWTTARTLSFTGDATGSGSVDGSANVATALTLANTAVTAGSYTNTSLTVDAKGRITSATSGAAPVTSVSATAPIASSGGATPTISISQASSTTNGYLSSTDWNTFNNKGSGTVTSVTGTAPIASTGGATPAISISQATTSTNGYLSSTDWNTFNGKWTNGTAMTATTGSFSGQVTSTVATGTAPMVIASTTKVANLNVEQVDGYHADTANTASTIAVRDASKNLALSGVVLSGSTSGTTTLVASAAAGTTTATLPATTGTIITTGDTGTVTNTMLAGSIANAKLTNSSVTVTAGTGLSGGGAISLGGSATVSLANTAVSAGSYTLASITVDAQGRITAASNGSASAFPAGTKMLFAQTAAPTGWTKDTVNYNDYALRVVTGTASSGGTVAFTTAFASQTPSGTVSSSFSSGSAASTTATGTIAVSGGAVASTTDTGTVGATTLATTQIPSHQHTVYNAPASQASTGTAVAAPTGTQQSGATGGGLSHNHTLTMNSHTHTFTQPTATFTGTAHTHTVTGSVSSSFSGSAINLAVKYLDVILASKD